jgi:hypothetical protein
MAASTTHAQRSTGDDDTAQEFVDDECHDVAVGPNGPAFTRVWPLNSAMLTARTHKGNTMKPIEGGRAGRCRSNARRGSRGASGTLE